MADIINITSRQQTPDGNVVPLRGRSHRAVTGSTVRSGPDAELIALCAEIGRLEAHLRLLNRRDTICSEEHMSDTCAALDAAFERVTELPATTPAGFRAKLVALRAATLDAVKDREPGWKTIADGEVHERMTDSLINDIQAAGGLTLSMCEDIVASCRRPYPGETGLAIASPASEAEDIDNAR